MRYPNCYAPPRRFDQSSLFHPLTPLAHSTPQQPRRKRTSVHGHNYGAKASIARTTTPYTSRENKLLKDIDGLDVRLEEIKRVSLNSGYSQVSAFSEPPIPTYVSRARPMHQMSMPVPQQMQQLPMAAAPGIYYIVPGVGQPGLGGAAVPVYPYQ